MLETTTTQSVDYISYNLCNK